MYIHLLNYNDVEDDKENITLATGKIDRDYEEYKKEYSKNKNNKSEEMLTKRDWLRNSINTKKPETITYVEQVGDGMTYLLEYTPIGVDSETVVLELSTKPTDGTHFAFSELSNMAANIIPNMIFSNTLSKTFRDGIFKINEGTTAERDVLYIPVSKGGSESKFKLVVLGKDGEVEKEFTNMGELKDYSFNQLGIKDLAILDNVKQRYKDLIDKSNLYPQNPTLKLRYAKEAENFLKETGFNSIDELDKVRKA